MLMKSVLITGAAGGMGWAAVKLFCERGYRVFALDIKEVDFGEGVVPIVADVTSGESVLRAAEAVGKYTESLDAILHFAGVYMLDSLLEIEDGQFRRIFDINLRGAYLINKHFAKFLHTGASILITTSELAPLDPLPFTGIYAVSKAALDKYAYSLRMEMQLLGVRVSVLRAGAVKTDMLGVSTSALDRFCENTKLYSCNAKRFKGIVERVEARSVEPSKISARALSIIEKKNPKFAYSINKNPLLSLLNILPSRVQFFAIRRILR